MRAFQVIGRGVGETAEVDAPTPGTGQVVVTIARAGICGTDIGLFTADATRLAHARTAFPLRLGHEWSGTVTRLGAGVDSSWLGGRVTGDTMLGCGHCDLCADGKHHVCEDRYEIGVRGGWPGALAEELLVPLSALHRLPDAVTDAMGAMVEPGGNAWRAVEAASLDPGRRLLIVGPGTIGLLCGLFALAAGLEVHLLGRGDLSLAARLGFAGVWRMDDLPPLAWHSVIDATDSAEMPAWAASAVEPAGRVVYIGVSPTASPVDTRTLVRRDVTAVGILGGSAGLDPAIAAYASGAVDPTPLIAATIPLGELPGHLAGTVDRAAGSPPKIHVDPALP